MIVISFLDQFGLFFVAIEFRTVPMLFFVSSRVPLIFFRSSNMAFESFFLLNISSCNLKNSLPYLASSLLMFYSNASIRIPNLYSFSLLSDSLLLSVWLLLKLLMERGDDGFLRLAKKFLLILISLEERTRLL